MKRKVLQEAEKIEKKRKRKKGWLKVVTCLAAVVVFVTTYALILPAITEEIDDESYVCGIEEHIHSSECYGEISEEMAESTEGEVLQVEETEIEGTETEGTEAAEVRICQLEEHEHGEACLPVYEKTFEYEDEYLSMTVQLSNEEAIPADTDISVLPITSEEETYAEYAEYAYEYTEGSLNGLMAYEIEFLSDGEQIELPDADVEVDLTINEVPDAEYEMAAMALELENEDEEETTEEVVIVLQAENDEITPGDTFRMSEEENGITTTLRLGATRSFALTRAASELPKFNVEYYADMNHISTGTDSGSSESSVKIPVINTLKNSEGNAPGLATSTADGGDLPVNGKGTTESPTNYPIYYLPLRTTSTTGVYELDMALQRIKIHTDQENVIYSSTLTVRNLDVLRENTHYDLDFIRTQSTAQKTAQTEDGLTDEEAIGNSKYWTTYTVASGADIYEQYYFTNNSSATEQNGKKPIVISEGMIVRYVYKPTTSTKESNDVAFFDYDISSGYTTNRNTKTMTTYTKNGGSQGINSASNYLNGTSGGVKLAFGNANTGTGLSQYSSSTKNVLSWEIWTDPLGVVNTINQANRSAEKGNAIRNGSYRFCTFGIVKGYDITTGKLTYADGIIAPYLFSYEPDNVTVKGKTTYSNSQLQFTRYGDTYTLTGVTGTDGISETDLNYFTYTTYETSSVTNNFWPMDGLTSTTDFKFGDYSSYNNGTKKYSGYSSGNYSGGTTGTGTLPLSDDALAHNSYFGMQFAVEFSLDGSYTGPLEYLFYGDDDMWVFLTDHTDPNNVTTRLIADIGGVHSSVGSYTDLWDWLPNTTDRPYGKGDYTLTFFYTERGASGSSCFMQFTIPGASAVPVTDVETGTLTVGKELAEDSDGITSEQEFIFDYELYTEADGTTTTVDSFFPYTIYDENNEAIGSGSIYGKGSFSLKEGQYIIISDIPLGTQYSVSESTQGSTVTWTQGAEPLDTLTPTGTINAASPAVVLKCVNQFSHLMLKKEINGVKTSETFTFELQLTDSNNTAIAGSYNAIVTDAGGNTTTKKVTFDTEGKVTVELKADQSIKIYNLPNNASWNITEKSKDGFVVSYSIADGTQSMIRTVSGYVADGTLQAGNNSIVCTNATSYELPKTGGIGTNWYTFGGLVLIGTGCLVYIKFRRKEDITL